MLKYDHSEIEQFSFELNQISNPSREDLKSVVESIQKSPSAKLFWLLSRMIRFAPPPEVKAIIDPLAKVILNNRSVYSAAVFANAHLLRVSHILSYPDGYKWCRNFCFTQNIQWNTLIYNLISLPSYSNILTPQFSFLDSCNVNIQNTAASAIAHHSKNPKNLLRRVLATFSSRPADDVSILELPPAPSPECQTIRMRGFLFLVSHLMSNPIPLSEYLDCLLPILYKIPETDSDFSLAMEAQNIVANLMLNHPTAFHSMNLFDAAMIQFKSNNFSPKFLNGLIFSFGFFAFKKFLAHLIPSWLDTLKKSGFEYIEILAPYCHYFDPQIQLNIHKSLVDFCRSNRFNRKVFETTALVFLTSHPTISPFLGEFIEIARCSVCSQSILAQLKSLVEPKVDPILHPMRD